MIRLLARVIASGIETEYACARVLIPYLRIDGPCVRGLTGSPSESVSDAEKGSQTAMHECVAV